MDIYDINNTVRWLKKGDSVKLEFMSKNVDYDWEGRAVTIGHDQVKLEGYTKFACGGFESTIVLTWYKETYLVRYLGETDTSDIDSIEVTMYQKVRGFFDAQL